MYGFFQSVHHVVGLDQYHCRSGGHFALGCQSSLHIRLRQHLFQRDMLALPGLNDMLQMFFQLVTGAAHQRRETRDLAFHLGIMHQKFAFQFHFQLPGSLARLHHETGRLQGDLLGEMAQPSALVDELGSIRDVAVYLVDKIQVAAGEQHEQQEHPAQLDAHRPTAQWDKEFR